MHRRPNVSLSSLCSRPAFQAATGKKHQAHDLIVGSFSLYMSLSPPLTSLSPPLFFSLSLSDDRGVGVWRVEMVRVVWWAAFQAELGTDHETHDLIVGTLALSLSPPPTTHPSL